MAPDKMTIKDAQAKLAQTNEAIGQTSATINVLEADSAKMKSGLLDMYIKTGVTDRDELIKKGFDATLVDTALEGKKGATGEPEKITEPIEFNPDLESEDSEISKEKNSAIEEIRKNLLVSYGKDKKAIKMEPKYIVEQFLNEYNLADKLPNGFENLSDDKKLYVVQNLKKRIVNIVKSDAETQYSEYLKNKMPSAVGDGKFQKMVTGLKNVMESILNSVAKEADLENMKNEVFEDLIQTKSGNELLKKDFELLTNTVEDKNIVYDKEEGFITIHISKKDIENCTEEEAKAINNFNRTAHKYQNIPYEWGQQNKAILGGNKRKYDKAKQEYEKARSLVLNIKVNKETGLNKKQAVLDMKQVDSNIQMEQLLNTHPEFEKIFSQITETSQNKRVFRILGKTFSNLFHTITGGRSNGNITKKLAFMGGFAIRSGTKLVLGASGLATSVGLITAPIFGATFGALRGNLKAKDELQKRGQQARYGNADESKERKNFANADDLTMRLETLSDKLLNIQNNPDAINEYIVVGDSFDIDGKRMLVQGILPDGTVSMIEITSHKWEEVNGKKVQVNTPVNESLNPIDINKNEMLSILETNLLDQIKRRIEFTKNKIEQGLVNFGDVKQALGNQFNLINNLNEAMVDSVMMENSVRKDIDVRLNSFLEKKAGGIESAQREFIKKQTIKSAKIGAGFATFGYVAHWFGEQMGWLGGAKVAGTSVAETPEVIPKVDVVSNTDQQQSVIISSPIVKPAVDNTYVHHNYEINKPIIENPIKTETTVVEATKIEDENPIKTETTVVEPPKVEVVEVPVIPEVEVVDENVVEVEVLKGHGAIQTLRELKVKLEAEYPDEATRPASIQHILETDETKLAMEYGMYKPNEVAESALTKVGDKFVIDKDGNVTYHQVDGNHDTLLEKGTDATASNLYEGRMLDSDHSGQIEHLKDSVVPIQKVPEGVEGVVPDQKVPEGIDNTVPIQKAPEGVEAPIKDEDSIVGHGPNANSIDDSRVTASNVVVDDNIYPTRPGGFSNVGTNTGNISPSQNVYEGGTIRNIPAKQIINTEDLVDKSNLESGEKNINIKTIEADPRHLETASSVKKEFGRQGYGLVINKMEPPAEGLTPGDNTIDGIKLNEWNKNVNDMFEANNIKFENYEDFTKERELQQLFGHARKAVEYIDGENTPTTHIEYFRDTKDWATINKIPAKDFFGSIKSGDELIDGSKISKESLDELIKNRILVPGETPGKYVFTHRVELERLSDTYSRLIPKEQLYGNNLPLVKADGKNENIEEYISRISKKVYETDDGTLYGTKKNVDFSQSNRDYTSGDGSVVRSEFGPLRRIPTGSISPTRGIYQTSVSNVGRENYGMVQRGVGGILGWLFR